MLLHEGLRQRQTEPGATFAAAHQRVKDAVTDVFGHAWAVVLDMQFQCQPKTLASKRDLARHPCAQHQPGIAFNHAVRQRVCGVVRDVQHGLDQLLAVAPKLRNAGVVVTRHLQAARLKWDGLMAQWRAGAERQAA